MTLVVIWKLHQKRDNKMVPTSTIATNMSTILLKITNGCKWKTLYVVLGAVLPTEEFPPVADVHNISYIDARGRISISGWLAYVDKNRILLSCQQGNSYVPAIGSSGQATTIAVAQYIPWIRFVWTGNNYCGCTVVYIPRIRFAWTGKNYCGCTACSTN